MKNNFCCWVSFFIVVSCVPKFYYKNDYSFYGKKTFRGNSLLRTDGFYILESEWHKRNDSLVLPDRYRIYKFYNGDQVNHILADSLGNAQEYLETMHRQIEEYG